MGSDDSQSTDQWVELSGDQATAGSGPDEAVADTATAATVPARPAPRVRLGDLPHGTRIGRYVVLGPIGAGGMGLVVKAFDPELDRQVAVKLIRPDDVRPGAAQRLLREAQALAKLAHPNVVPVFDVGEFEGGVFVAMELIDGLSVSQWLRRRRRSRREILSVFTAAGRGLEAAHRAGLVHRDFKPSNVVVGDDGRVRVLDFGLACVPHSQQPPDAGEAPPESEPPSSDSLLGTPLTRAGAVVGTPGYMSPEQEQGGTVGARSDQFSYCAALYRALCGKLPFPGGVGDSAPPGRRDSRLPAWLHRILVRGLQRDPADRFASMSDLLAALARGEGRRRRFAVAVAAALAVGGLAVGLGLQLFRSHAPALCRAGSGEVAAVWNPAARARVAAAFADSGRSYAEDSWRRAAPVLDRFAAAWAAARDQSCRATRVLGTQSEALLDRRTVCLDRRLAELRATVELLEHAGPGEVDRAIELVTGLTPVDRCADRALLHSDVELVEDPALRDRVAEVAAQLDRAHVLSRAGKVADAEVLAENAVARAEKLDYPPLLAEALFRLGDCQLETEGFAAARATTERAFQAALAAGDDQIAAWAAMQMLYFLSYDGGDPAAVDLWAGIAASYPDRVSEPAAYRSRLEQHLANVAATRGDDAAALDHMEAALRIIQAEPDPAPFDVTDQLSHLAAQYSRNGRYQDALDKNSEAIELAEKLVGPHHIMVGKYLVNQVDPLLALGRNQEALAAARRSLAILESALGPSHTFVGLAVVRVARSLAALGQRADGLVMARRAVDIYRRDPGPHGSWLVDALLLAGELDSDRALVTWLDEAVQVAERERPSAEQWAENMELNAACAAADRGACSAAEPWLERMHARVADREGWDDLLSVSLAVAGQCRLAAGDVDRALALAERAADHQRRATGIDSTYLPRLQLRLAERLVARDRRRARGLALAALEYLSHYDHTPARELSREITAWLDRHGGRAR